ncbi:MAG: c-type cytochrome [Polaromonas sp.]|nr:c-type cytochrome [Polaromonas sp.]
MKKSALVLTTVAAGLAAALAGAGFVVYSGIYNVGATSQHLQPVHSLLETTMQQSVRWRARQIEPPQLEDPARIARGGALYQANCVQCHGAPGVAQAGIGQSMQPVPGPLVDAMQRWRAREVYWITRHGIKISGMPAWEFRLDEEALWDVVAFVQHLPKLTPQDYAKVAQGKPPPDADAPARSQGSELERGQLALTQYACQACHTIPGVTSSSPNVGPPLQGLASRSLIAGKLANTPDNLVKWIRDPREFKPLTAMPDMNVSEGDARDMAAYLGTLR